jgi:hypothetical protein
MNNSFKSFYLIFFVLVSAHPSAAQNNPGYNPDWENNIYNRIDIVPVDGGFQMEGYWVWGSSVIKGDDGLYHMFVSRWPKNIPFHPGWLVASEIVHAVSQTPEGPYKFSDVVLSARGAQYWDGRSTHNPKITKYKDSYILFYMGSTHPFDDVTNPDILTPDSEYAIVGRSNKRIGIATSKSLNGPWERCDEPILDTKPNTFYSFLTSNPAPWINEDGSVILVFKSRAYNEKFPYHGEMSIGVATAPAYEGPYTVADDNRIFGIDKIGEAEDPSIWKDETGYHMIIKDQRGQITGQKYSGFLVHSYDGINWELEKNKLIVYDKTIEWNDGTSELMGRLERAFPLIENGKITHLFFAAMDGTGSFDTATKSWNIVILLKPDAK